ncbi:MAG: hypothetical protein LBD29_04480 [Treponema sp.]|nr:hypothetical protein [Treponema sp.]
MVKKSNRPTHAAWVSNVYGETVRPGSITTTGVLLVVVHRATGTSLKPMP